jgi:prevent-host-death family protein
VNTFSIRDLRERTGELVRTAEAGQLSVVAKHGQPVFVAVPFSQALLANGVNVALALGLYQAHLFMDCLGNFGVPVIDYDPAELSRELEVLGE